MRIREATVNDAAALARVHVDSWRATYAGIVPADYLARLSYEQGERRWREILSAAEGDRFVYVAEDEEGQVVGFACGGPEHSGDPVYTGELHAIYLLAGHQGRGTGRQLFLATGQRLLQQGYEAMRVWVLADNPSRGFYEALGGRLLAEKAITIGTAELLEVAYGWPDLRLLVETAR